MLAEGALLVKMVVWPLKASIRIAWKLLIGIWGRSYNYDQHSLKPNEIYVYDIVVDMECVTKAL